ncbi:transcriptional regulator, TetR family [Tistlia consotensis]|uniref:Transcriptional regulator, TetR family n=1 Tax=Tistlia consotensis USBA 355 TaxID=560819 RepID=A0A1Y6BC90_9PROT|nr:TetR/AcrR family transcriptional regulator [Tistlia consotensis]SME93462.1 transcriptional regulator, TetR family [Tistlia consotensis USBA 355]SNR28638.1 transcriptional regulator, TetR family [Tistlia consotensis]
MARTVAERSDTLPALAEVFREHGYEGASLTLIGEATGLGKGSLYHFFPGGKQEMAAAVLAEIDGWFEREIFAPLRSAQPPAAGIAAMFDGVEAYFRSGRRVCLVGAFALGDARDRFAEPVRGYFSRWIKALATALTREGHEVAEARRLAEGAVAGIQGAIVLARALDDPRVFARCLDALRDALGGPGGGPGGGGSEGRRPPA